MSSTAPPPRGLLIVIEGLDRSGKSTQCDRLVTAVSQSTPPSTSSSDPNSTIPTTTTTVRLQKFPDRTTPTGTLINSYLTNQTQQDDHAIHLLFSANRWEARSQILSDIAAGTTVIVDRYSFSGAVYSAAKGREDLGVEWAWSPEVGLPCPDLVVFLDLDEEVARARGGWGEERYEKVEMQRVVRRLYRDVLDRVGQSGVLVRVVDAGVGVEEVERRVWECYVDALEGFRGREGRGESVEVGRLGVL